MVREAVAHRIESLSPLDGYFQPSQAARLAGLLRVAAPVGISLEVVDLSDASVRIQGLSPNPDACRRVDDYLRLQGYRTHLDSKVQEEGGAVTFTIEGNRS